MTAPFDPQQILSELSPEACLGLYTTLIRIRNVSLTIEKHDPEDQMKSPVHRALGEEAVAAGVCAHLRREDTVFSNHRSHAHYLAKGGDLKAMIAELHCKETGCAKGRGGSMHLIDKSVGHFGSSAIVGGSIPHAVGAAFAAVMRKTGLVSVSFMGDAATEQGVFFESLNWAALKKLPVVFVCENNFYSVCSHISARQANDTIAMRPAAFAIPSAQVDGMNVLEVYARAREAVRHARGGHGPYFLECRVQRWRAHAGAGDPICAQYRRPEECREGFLRDPIRDFVEMVTSRGMVKEPELRDIEGKVNHEIEEAFRFAKESPLPDKDDLLKHLFV